MAIFNSRLIHYRQLHRQLRICLLVVLWTTVFSPAFAQPAQSNSQTETDSTTQDKKAAGNHQLNQQLIDALPDQNVVWLDQDKTVIGRFDAAVDPFQMAVLAFSDNMQKLDTPEILDAMHNHLPLHGWSILTITLPTETPGNPDISKRPEVAIDYLKGQQAKSLAVFAGTGQIRQAFETTIAYSDFVSGLVLWQVDDIGFSPEELKKLKESKISILDIAPLQANSNELAQRRKNFAQAGIQQHYKLIALPEFIPGETGVKRIRHWLEHEFEH